jgi:3-dehydroquinate synthase
MIRNGPLVLTGFMGTGKTTVGRLLAEMLGQPFFDLDAEVEKHAGKSVSDFFVHQGEGAFREWESRVLGVLLKNGHGVIATGGGTLLSEKNRARIFSQGTPILLKASTEALVRRLSGEKTRPLLRSAQRAGRLAAEIEEIQSQRSKVYSTVEYQVDTTHRQADEVAGEIAILAHGDSCRMEAMDAPRQHATQILTGRGSLSKVGQHLRACGFVRAFVLMPESVSVHHRVQVDQSLRQSQVEAEFITVFDGDSEKNLRQAESLLDEMADRGAARDTPVVAMGGGVTGDLSGFVASIYMRGVPLFLLPTTLLAQVDASIGGKVGVNHHGTKNGVGAFYPPRMVISDPCVLRTLPLEELSNGMAEVVKSALLASADFFSWLESQKHRPLEEALRDISFLEECVQRSVAIKADVVRKDPLEKDERRLLNLGHTLGHALESATDFAAFKHGQAVAIGLVAAHRIAEGRGQVSAHEVQRVVELLTWCGLPTHGGHALSPAVKTAMMRDKKFKNGRLHFVLPLGIGKACIVDDVSPEEILATQEGL